MKKCSNDYKQLLRLIDLDTGSMNDLFFYLHRLYTGPKDSSFSQVLSSPAYKKVMEKNVHLEHSFNDWSRSIEKTLKEPKKAYFAIFNKANRIQLTVKQAKYQVHLKFR